MLNILLVLLGRWGQEQESGHQEWRVLARQRDSHGALATQLLAASRPLHLSISWSQKNPHIKSPVTKWIWKLNSFNTLEMWSVWVTFKSRCSIPGWWKVGALRPSRDTKRVWKLYFNLLSYRYRNFAESKSRTGKQTVQNVQSFIPVPVEIFSLMSHWKVLFKKQEFIFLL